jgi:hypothetical protein
MDLHLNYEKPDSQSTHMVTLGACLQSLLQ